MSIRIFGSGGGVITDATATPDIVKQGYVFYNNNGRQIGTNSNIKTQITKVFNYTGSMTNATPLSNDKVRWFGSNGYFKIGYLSVYNEDDYDGYRNITSEHHTSGEDMVIPSSYWIEFCKNDKPTLMLQLYSNLNINIRNIAYIQYSKYKLRFANTFKMDKEDAGCLFSFSESYDPYNGSCTSSGWTHYLKPVFSIDANDILTDIGFTYEVNTNYGDYDVLSVNIKSINPITVVYYS